MNLNPRITSWRLVLLGAFLSAPAGCGSTGSLEGTVSSRSNGKVLTSGTVTAIGSDNLPRQGGINQDGTYRVAGLPLGTAQLTVSSPDPRGPAPGSRRQSAPVAPNAPARSAPRHEKTKEVHRGWFLIPEKYALPQTSGLSAEVKHGRNTHNIVLD